MKKRIIWKMFVLEFVTLGIYRLYWLIKTRSEMMRSNPNVKIKSPWFLVLPVFIVAVAIVGFVALTYMSAPDANKCPDYYSKTSYNAPKKPVQNPECNKANTVLLISSLLLPLAIVLGLAIYVIWLWDYCHGVEIITNEKISFAIGLVILVLVPDGIDILIIQDGFNKAVDRAAGITPGQPLPPTQPVPPAAPQPPVNPPAPVQFQLA